MRKSKSFVDALVALPSSIMLVIFFLIPFCFVLLASVAVPTANGDYQFGFDLQHFHRFLTPFYIERALYSVVIATVVAILSLLLAFPFSYFLCAMSQRARSLWLIYILAQLSLSEVLIAFSWQILLSRTAGLSHLLVMVGFVERTFSMYPSVGAVLVALVYLAIPFAVLLLYPVLSRIDPHLMEAARSLGASPLKAFFNVIVPVARPALVASGITVFVLTLGAVIVPQVLGSPEHWSLSVLITDQAIYNFNIPFASALAVVLLLLSGLTLASVSIFGKEKSV